MSSNRTSPEGPSVSPRKTAASDLPSPPDAGNLVLIDRFLPRWDARERHRIAIRAVPAEVYSALRTVDLAGHPLVRALLLLRAIPAALSRSPRRRELRTRASQPITLATFEEQGFRVLAEDPPHELLIGLEGAFWKPSGELHPVDPVSFREPVPAGRARAAWNFSIAPASAGGCVLHTETRVLTGDAGARWRFRLYWLLVRPGSGLIRRLMLRAIRREAERSPAWPQQAISPRHE
jgi:hypothetical protein